MRILKYFMIFLCVLICFQVPHKVNAERVVQKWKVATLAPAGVGWALYIDEILTPSVKDATAGRLVLEWFWGGSMGDEKDYIRKMLSDELQGIGFSGAGFVMACPEASVIELPFLFNNYNEVDYIKEKMRDDFEAICRQNGYKFMFWVDQDFDKIYSVSTMIHKPADFEKAKFLTWYGDLEKSFLEYLNASPLNVDVSDVNISITSGLCDSFIAPSIWVVGSMLYTKIKYVHTMPIRYSPSGLLVTLKAWNSLPDIYKKGLIQKRYREKEFNKKVRKANTDCINAMIAYGIKEIKLTPKENELLRDTCKELWYEFADKFYPRKMLDEILKNLEVYRAQHN